MQKGGEISGYPTHLADADEEGLDKDIAIAQNEEGILELVDEAPNRIDDGTYGKCEECGEPIPSGTTRRDSVHAVLLSAALRNRIRLTPRSLSCCAGVLACSATCRRGRLHHPTLRAHSGSDDWCDHQRSTAAGFGGFESITLQMKPVSGSDRLLELEVVELFVMPGKQSAAAIARTSAGSEIHTLGA